MDSDAPAVVYAETLSPQGSHRVYSYRLQIAIPLVRMPDDLQDDPRVIALRKMCKANGISWTHTLSLNEDLRGPIYDCAIEVDNLVED